MFELCVVLRVYAWCVGCWGVRAIRHVSPLQTPPDLPTEGIFTWIRPLLHTNQAELLPYVGMDGLVFLRYFSMCAKICVCFAPYAFFVLIPIDATAGDNSSNYFNRWTISNIRVTGTFDVRGLLLGELECVDCTGPMHG